MLLRQGHQQQWPRTGAELGEHVACAIISVQEREGDTRILDLHLKNQVLWKGQAPDTILHEQSSGHTSKWACRLPTGCKTWSELGGGSEACLPSSSACQMTFQGGQLVLRRGLWRNTAGSNKIPSVDYHVSVLGMRQ